MNVNKVFIIGRLTSDPELRSTPSGQSVSTLSIATNRVWTDKSGRKQEEAEYHNVVVWGKQAEIVHQFLTKGSMIFVEGRLKTRSWQDKQGQARKTTEIVCERLQLGPRPAGVNAPSAKAVNGASQEETSKARAEEIPVIDIEEEAKPEDLPF